MLDAVDFQGCTDGGLPVRPDGEVGSFNDLQQRLGKKKHTAKLMREKPAHIMAYDIITAGQSNVQALPFNRAQIRR